MIPIETERLSLIPLPPALLSLLREDRLGEACALSGCVFVESWREVTDFIDLRYEALINDASFQPWSVRAVVRRIDRRVIGHIGFHEKPGGTYSPFLRPLGAEIGYTIFEPYRRQGFACEALRALRRWGIENGSSHCLLSIAPHNIASQSLARKLGFTKIGSHIDDVDGLEEVFAWAPGGLGLDITSP